MFNSRLLGCAVVALETTEGDLPLNGYDSTLTPTLYFWGLSSAGRASGLHPEGQRFDPVRLHQVLSVKTFTKGGM